METSFIISSSELCTEMPAVETAIIAVAPVPTLSRRCRRITGVRAESSWQLQRTRRVAPMRPEQTQHMRLLIGDMEIRGEALHFHGNTYRVRPIVAAMLQCLFSRGGMDWQVADLSQAVYGRAASMRAIRQTVFRVNRALENVNCPMAAYCHGAVVFLRPRVRVFERVGGQ